VPPTPAECGHGPLTLETAQEAIHAAVFAAEVVSRREARNYLTIQSFRTQDDPVVSEGDQQVRSRDLAFGWGARSPKVGDLEFAQHRTTEYVCQTAVREMHHFRKSCPRAPCLLQPGQLPNVVAQDAMPVAEAAQQGGRGGATYGMQERLKVSLRDGLRRPARQHDKRPEGIGERWCLGVTQLFEIPPIEFGCQQPFALSSFDNPKEGCLLCPPWC
jgi:hypothetical protein